MLIRLGFVHLIADIGFLPPLPNSGFVQRRIERAASVGDVPVADL